MKKIVSILAFLFAITSVFGQAKKPRIMIVPSNQWCISNGYFDEVDNQGIKTKVPNYRKAFNENPEINSVINKMGELMQQRGFPLEKLEDALSKIENDAAEDAMLQSKNSGASIATTAYEKLNNKANCDIKMQIAWTVLPTGSPQKKVDFNISGVDAYSNKQIAGASGVSDPSTATVTEMLYAAVISHIDKFQNQLQDHFNDLFENGREVVIQIKKFGSWDGDLEKTFDGKELKEIIENWLAANTVKGRFNTEASSANSVEFTQVRIPLYDENNRALDANAFARKLQKFLQASPYNITNKLISKGLGKALIVLGDK